MRTGKLSISRGSALGAPGPVAPRLSVVPRSDPEPSPAPAIRPSIPPAAPVAPAALTVPEYHLVHDRLTALERLARLREAGALSAEEFAEEKAIVLGLPSDELVLFHPAPDADAGPAHSRRAHGPSLIGRLLGWKLLPLGLVAGLGLSFASQPQETLRFFDEALRLFGA